MDGYWLRVYRCVYDQGSGEDHYVEKTLGHVSAWLQDTQGADAWSKGLWWWRVHAVSEKNNVLKVFILTIYSLLNFLFKPDEYNPRAPMGCKYACL